VNSVVHGDPCHDAAAAVVVGCAAAAVVVGSQPGASYGLGIKVAGIFPSPAQSVSGSAHEVAKWR
jgi:hypothetical protein